MGKSDFEVMMEMSRKNMDIAMSGAMVEAKKVKKGGHITMGVSPDSFEKIIQAAFTGEQEYFVALYVINKQQFLELQNAPSV